MGIDLGISDLSGASKSKNVTETEKSEIKPMTQTHPMIGRNLRIDSDRLWQSLMDMAKIGPGAAGGNNRQALTDDDSTARHLFQSWCEAECLTLQTDKMGNMFARRDGSNAGLPPVMVGKLASLPSRRANILPILSV